MDAAELIIEWSARDRLPETLRNGQLTDSNSETEEGALSAS